MRVITVTIGAGLRTQIAVPLAGVSNILNYYTGYVIFQNASAANPCYIGDNTVTSTNGVALVSTAATVPGNSISIIRNDNRIPLFEYYVAGTSGQKLTVLYE